MRSLLKWGATAALLIYLVLGEGPAPTAARETWHTVDKGIARAALSWGVRLRMHSPMAEWGERAIVWLWQSQDDQEKEVMRRYLLLRGLTLR